MNREVQEEQAGEVQDKNDELVESGGITYSSINASDVRALAENYPDFLGGLVTPDTHTVELPPVYLTIWGILTGYAREVRGLFKYFALGLPRGFGKTSLVKLLAVWVILFTNRKFLLIVAETQEKAQYIMSDIFDMLSESNVKAAFGDWTIGCTQDTLRVKKFSFRGRQLVVACLGVQGSVRGLNIKNVRPDFMLLDDIQSREAADSPVESKKIERWMQGTLLKAKSNIGCLTIFIGNMYPTENCLLRKLKANKIWEKVIAGGLLISDEGKIESLWEGIRSLESLIQEYELDKEANQEETFFAEVLNDENITINGLIDLNAIPQLPFDPVEEANSHQGSYIVIDPATGKLNADQVAIGYYQVYDGRNVLWEILADRFSPMETVQKTLAACAKYGCRLIFVESVAYQATLAYWFRFFIDKLGIEGIEVVEIYPGKMNKNSRILTMFKQLTGMEGQVPEIFLHPQVRNKVMHQIKEFDYLKTNNRDDILDLLTYGPVILARYGALLRTYAPLQMLMDPPVSSLEFSTESNSPF